ncbi:PREDICTED: T-cell antigen CD7 [Myotis brandtii]|uniref:T-cell antigen CD7 n=1 Tax=Myotis brandtii TaxID=109478 RepID=UPI000703CD8A|nr:PREDICTED: T-cell antigen CD7 [Myotis brandtii]
MPEVPREAGPVRRLAGDLAGPSARELRDQPLLHPSSRAGEGAPGDQLCLQHAPEVRQSPLYTVTPEGGSINITCSVRVNGTLLGVHLRQSHLPAMRKVTYYDDENTPTVDARFQGRVVFSGTMDNLTITMQRLRPADTGAYFCSARLLQGASWISPPLGAPPPTCTRTLKALMDSPHFFPDTLSPAASACPGTQPTGFTFPVALALGCLLVVLGLAAMCVLKRRQIRNMCSARDRSTACVIYEDMSSSRRNTISIANHYQ